MTFSTPASTPLGNFLLCKLSHVVKFRSPSHIDYGWVYSEGSSVEVFDAQGMRPGCRIFFYQIVTQILTEREI